MIGEAMPRFDRLSAAFKDDFEFQHVMGHFYSDILEFHRRCKLFREASYLFCQLLMLDQPTSSSGNEVRSLGFLAEMQH